jgi:hypothetical protein
MTNASCCCSHAYYAICMLISFRGQPDRQAGRHTSMHLNLMTKLHACHAQMKLDPDLQTLRETDLHMDLHSARAPCISMHAFPKERDHNSREKGEGRPGLPSRPEKKKLKSRMHAWLLLAMAGRSCSITRKGGNCGRLAAGLPPFRRTRQEHVYICI